MSKRGSAYGHNRVNILKKVKGGRVWNFYPAVVECNGHLTSFPHAVARKNHRFGGASVCVGCDTVYVHGTGLLVSLHSAVPTGLRLSWVSRCQSGHAEFI